MAAYLATKVCIKEQHINAHTKVRHYKTTLMNAVVYATNMILGRQGAEKPEEGKENTSRRY